MNDYYSNIAISASNTIISPTDLAGCMLVLDPRDTATLTINRDGTGGNPAVDSTDVVGRLYDQSGNGRIYSATADSRRARFRDNPAVFDGRRCLEYDRVDDFYPPTAQWAISGPQTWCLEFQQSVDAVGLVIGSYTGAAGSSLFLYQKNAGRPSFSMIVNTLATAASVGFGGINGALYSTARRRVVFTYDGTGPSNVGAYTARLDGVAQTIVASGNASMSTVWGAMGGTTTVGNLWGGRIGRICKFNRVLTATEIGQMEGWLDAPTLHLLSDPLGRDCLCGGCRAARGAGTRAFLRGRDRRATERRRTRSDHPSLVLRGTDG